MKRITSLLIFVGMILILVGCGKTQTPVPDAGGKADAEVQESMPADKEDLSAPPPADTPALPEEDTILKPNPTISVDELKEEYPEYFDLSAFKGLEVMSGRWRRTAIPAAFCRVRTGKRRWKNCGT